MQLQECGGVMKQNKYQPPNEPGRTIQTRLHPSGGEIEIGAIYVYDTRRARGENPRDFVALALSELGVDGKPASFDEGTANWFLQRIFESQDELISILTGNIADMLSNLKTLASTSGDNRLNYADVEGELSEFEKNLRETSSARRQSFDL